MAQYVKKPVTYNAIKYTGDVASFTSALAAASTQIGFEVFVGVDRLVVRCGATAFTEMVEIAPNQYLVFGESQAERPYASDLSGLAPYGDVYVTASGGEPGQGADGTVQYFTLRPGKIAAIEWTGANFSAVQEFCANWGMEVVNNGDGTVSVSGGTGVGDHIPAGYWISNGLAMATSAAQLNQGYVRLPGDGVGPYQYDIQLS
ncbi:hypothetical protein ABT256_12395 [Amycolatopsis japonica]|uniref:hypothetical protein n=1 Tax=Amycolatopsis japonica TaxID=208439 RepID=UPI00332E0D42